MGYPKPAGWFVMENPNITWMTNRGPLILGNLHIYRIYIVQWGA